MNCRRMLGRATTYGGLMAAVALLGFSGCVPIIVVGPPAPVYYAPPPPSPAYYYPPPQPEPPPPVQESSDTELQQLVAPIALYPDPILADILPASTFPDQIQAANQWLQENPSPPDDAIAAQPWDPSVQALVHYPTVLNYMSSEIQWTQSLGSAVTNEQPDVMAAVQDLRAQAMAQGNLVNTPQQVVVQEGSTIYIQPANPQFIYIPVYDPVAVYGGPWRVTFGVAYVPGVWLGYGFDWHNHYFFRGDWRGGGAYGPYGWRPTRVGADPAGGSAMVDGDDRPTCVLGITHTGMKSWPTERNGIAWSPRIGTKFARRARGELRGEDHRGNVERGGVERGGGPEAKPAIKKAPEKKPEKKS